MPERRRFSFSDLYALLISSISGTDRIIPCGSRTILLRSDAALRIGVFFLGIRLNGADTLCVASESLSAQHRAGGRSILSAMARN